METADSMDIISRLKRITVRKLIDYFVQNLKRTPLLLFGRPIFRGFNKFLFMSSLKGLGFNSMVGEKKFVKYLCKQIDDDSSIALDIGAHEGVYSKYLLSNSRSLKVIGFEPHPSTFPKLTQNMSVFEERFSGRNLAVGSIEGEFKLFDYADLDGSVVASLCEEGFTVSTTPFHNGKVTHNNVRVIALDNELTEEEMSRIRFIKIDVEGNDKEVLVGAKKLVEKAGDNLYAIQIEFCWNAIYRKFFVKDIIELLPGFDIYRLLPSGKLLNLSNFLDWRQEIFAYQNLVFLNKANKTKLY